MEKIIDTYNTKIKERNNIIRSINRELITTWFIQNLNKNETLKLLKAQRNVYKNP